MHKVITLNSSICLSVYKKNFIVLAPFTTSKHSRNFKNSPTSTFMHLITGLTFNSLYFQLFLTIRIRSNFTIHLQGRFHAHTHATTVLACIVQEAMAASCQYQILDIERAKAFAVTHSMHVGYVL